METEFPGNREQRAAPPKSQAPFPDPPTGLAALDRFAARKLGADAIVSQHEFA